MFFKKAFCELCVFSSTVCWSPANILVNRYVVQAQSGHMFCRLENDSEIFWRPWRHIFKSYSVWYAFIGRM